jgi:hypothetical protein
MADEPNRQSAGWLPVQEATWRHACAGSWMRQCVQEAFVARRATNFLERVHARCRMEAMARLGVYSSASTTSATR